ncbi:MAG: hypothetical protein LBQ25_10310 [Azonexus sp.]|jgi:hypothetical protein|nr:hypothetical protein [Azonexus sp.]
MKKILAAVLVALLAVNVAYAESAADCEAKAVSKSGKPLAGAAKKTFMKKCMRADSAVVTACEGKAVNKNGKPLAGAAKRSFMKKCEAEGGR